MNTPYIDLVPKDFKANLLFREEMIRTGSESKENAHELWIMSARDPLFYVNTFCWTYDPRKVASPALPFITWDFQDKTFETIFDSNEDIHIEKSRDMGASWMCLTAFQWEWQFLDLTSLLMLSRKEDLVDKTNDPDSLFWKVDFINKNNPSWLRPNFERTRLMLTNVDNGSTIAGDSTGGDVARGGRRKRILLDEFASVENGFEVLASTQSNTKCRIFNSTPKGQGNAFYKVRSTSAKKLRLHWTLHPEKIEGLYTDPETGKLRSPWYDDECKRAPHPMLIKQELDIDYLGSDFQFFDGPDIDSLQKLHARKAYLQGEIEFDEDLHVKRFTPNEKGCLRLWFHLDHMDRPPDMDVVLGIDTATGTGASNSVISGGNKRLGEKILEYTNPNIVPEDLARYAVALARWLRALLIWEANGNGRILGKKVYEYGYRRIYYRRKDESTKNKISDVPGWFSTPKSKLDLLGDYRAALKGRKFINRSPEALEECKSYVFMSHGIVAHSSSFNEIDPSGAEDNHGDRVIADALVVRGMKDIGVHEAEAPKTPVGCFQWRREQREEQRSSQKSW